MIVFLFKLLFKKNIIIDDFYLSRIIDDFYIKDYPMHLSGAFIQNIYIVTKKNKKIIDDNNTNRFQWNNFE